MDVIEHNRAAWNRLSDEGILWGIPVDASAVIEASKGFWQVQLAGQQNVPHAWFGPDGEVVGKDILCMASGGGQQSPLLAAAGAKVVSLELSDSMLAKDRKLAHKHNLDLRCEQGSMTDLSRFPDNSFDVVFLPVAVCYVPDVHVVWRECARVLRANGRLLAGMINPLVNLFEENEGEDGVGLHVVNELPFAEIESLTEAEREAAIARGMVFVWSHTLTDLIGGQLSAGFRLLEFAEARRVDPRAPSINRYSATYIMTAAELMANH
ncbi:MAG: class I SAM-dependent methyltransferase [Pseudomonadales bacterium]